MLTEGIAAFWSAVACRMYLRPKWRNMPCGDGEEGGFPVLSRACVELWKEPDYDSLTCVCLRMGRLSFRRSSPLGTVGQLPHLLQAGSF